MDKFIIFLYRLISLYLYFVLGACVLSWIPNINPNYPMFHCIFKVAGFYLMPPVMGMLLSPVIVLILTSLVLMGLGKIYNKFFKCRIYFVSSSELYKNGRKTNNITPQDEDSKQEGKDTNNDCN